MIEYRAATKGRLVKNEWIPSHQDKGREWTTINDLQQMKLPNSAILNIWCDKEANTARQQYLTQCAEVYPNERWALFTTDPYPQKLTGKLDNGILQQLHTESLTTYIHKKHGLCLTKQEQLHLDGLHQYLSQLKIHHRANMVKLIH